MDPEPQTLHHPDPDELASSVASRLVEVVRAAQAQGRTPGIVLTGGSIADRIHRAVVAAADAADAADVAWGDVDWWYGDERFVAADDTDRNALQSRIAMLDHLPVDPSRVHEMPSADGAFGNDLEVAAAAYGQEVRSHGAGEFDVVMLGVGPDGHVASLFPGFPELDVEDTIAVAVRDSPKPPPRRISLTFPALESTREVWFVVAGADKADAVRRALTPGADVHEVPAGRPRGRQQTLWFLDQAAAGQA